MSDARDFSSEDRGDTKASAITPRATKTRLVLRWLFRVMLGLLVTGLATYYFDTRRSDAAVAALVADLDVNDPGWRLEELEAARPDIPDDRNSARLSRELAKILDPSWPGEPFDQWIRDLPLAELLDAPQMDSLEQEMKSLEAVREAANPMADLTEGRHRIGWADNLIRTKLPDQNDARRVAKLFQYEMLYRANRGDTREAMRASLGCICTARSLSDEPFMISQVVRIALTIRSLAGIERTLSLGSATDEDMIRLEALLQDEEKHNGYLVGARGERASAYVIYTRLASGDLSVDPAKAKANWLDRANLFARMRLARSQSLMMRLMNRWVEVARLPPHQQVASEDVLLGEIHEHQKTSPLSLILLPAANKLGQAWRRKKALIASMRGLIAVERYRMKYGEWPARFADVVPKFLKEVPADPFDGKPIRMAWLPDGVVVYSVGLDGVDDGGKLDRRNPSATGTDLGFQLWDVRERRRPASPAKPEGEP